MEKFMSMVEGSSSEIWDVEQMDENLFKELLLKNSVWDSHNMSRDEYTTKSTSEKEILIIKYYNEMQKGNSLSFSLVCVFIVWINHNGFIKMLLHFLF